MFSLSDFVKREMNGREFSLVNGFVRRYRDNGFRLYDYLLFWYIYGVIFDNNLVIEDDEEDEQTNLWNAWLNWIPSNKKQYNMIYFLKNQIISYVSNHNHEFFTYSCKFYNLLSEEGRDYRIPSYKLGQVRLRMSSMCKLKILSERLERIFNNDNGIDLLMLDLLNHCDYPLHMIEHFQESEDYIMSLYREHYAQGRYELSLLDSIYDDILEDRKHFNILFGCLECRSLLFDSDSDTEDDKIYTMMKTKKNEELDDEAYTYGKHDVFNVFVNGLNLYSILPLSRRNIVDNTISFKVQTPEGVETFDLELIIFYRLLVLHQSNLGLNDIPYKPTVMLEVLFTNTPYPPLPAGVLLNAYNLAVMCKWIEPDLFPRLRC